MKQDNEKKGINQGLLLTPSPGPEGFEVSSVEDEDYSSLSEEESEENSDDSSESPKPKRAKTGLE
jgi:hypothetical protein